MTSLRLVLFIAIAVLAIVLIGASILKQKLYAPFISNAQSVRPGDSVEVVERKMQPFKATTNNLDLGTFDRPVVIYRRYDVIWIFYLDASNKVARAEKRKT